MNRGYVRGKAGIRPSKAQKELFLNVVRWLGRKNTTGRPIEVAQEVIFPWSIGDKGAGYRYDIVVPDLNLIIEYDSTLHSKYSKHFHHDLKNFSVLQQRDEIKTYLATSNGYDIIRVDERDPTGGLVVRGYIDRKLTA